jgi:hypothetical protein
MSSPEFSPESDAAQMNCMKNLPYRTLKDAVIATAASFLVLIDGWAFHIFRTSKR